MHFSTSQKIIEDYELIDGEVSKEILWAIRNNAKIDANLLPRHISLHDIENLRDLYKQKLQHTSQSSLTKPRNKIFYELIKEKYPSFNWQLNGKSVVFDHVRINKLEPSLLSLLLKKITVPPLISFRYDCLNKLSDELLTTLNELFTQLDILYPDEQSMSAIIDWVYLGLHGEELNIFSLACPDYSVEPTGNPECPYKHTFNELGDGIGLIAKRILNAIPIIKEKFDTLGIKVKFTIAMADYEILSEKNLARLNLSFNEFLQKIQSSVTAFKKYSPMIKSVMLTDLCNGYLAWEQLQQQYHHQFEKNDFGKIALNKENLITMLKKRKPLYEKWYGDKAFLLDYLPILLDQASEYATVGELIHDNFKNCLILGADDPVFAPFYSVNQSQPALYLKRFYC